MYFSREVSSGENTQSPTPPSAWLKMVCMDLDKLFISSHTKYSRENEQYIIIFRIVLDPLCHFAMRFGLGREGTHKMERVSSKQFLILLKLVLVWRARHRWREENGAPNSMVKTMSKTANTNKPKQKRRNEMDSNWEPDDGPVGSRMNECSGCNRKSFDSACIRHTIIWLVHVCQLQFICLLTWRHPFELDVSIIESHTTTADRLMYKHAMLFQRANVYSLALVLALSQCVADFDDWMCGDQPNKWTSNWHDDECIVISWPVWVCVLLQMCWRWRLFRFFNVVYEIHRTQKRAHAPCNCL